MNSKSPANKTPTRKKNTSSFQDLNLFMTEIEIIHQFKVYCTETTQFFLQLKKSQCDFIKQKKKCVFLRFSKNDDSRTQKDYLPKSVSISINYVSLTLDSKSKSKNWKCPLDITNYIRSVTTRNANNLQFDLNHSKTLLSSGYGIEIVLAKKLSIGEQIQLLKSDLYIRKKDDALKIIKDNWASTDDVECQTMRVPLTCSVTRTRIKLPLVGSKCKHFACFDGQTFLEMMLNKPEWICPICFNLIRKNELKRDLLCTEILDSQQKDVHTIEFNKDGEYKPAEPEKATSKQKSKKIECIVLNDLDDLGNDLENLTNANSTNLNDLLTPKLESLEQLSTFNQNENNLSPVFVSTLNNNLTLNSTSNSGLNFQSSPQSRNNSTFNQEIVDVSDNNSIIVLDSDSDVSSSATVNSDQRYSYFDHLHQTFSSNVSNNSNSDTEIDDISSILSQSSLNSSNDSSIRLRTRRRADAFSSSENDSDRSDHTFSFNHNSNSNISDENMFESELEYDSDSSLDSNASSSSNNSNSSRDSSSSTPNKSFSSPLLQSRHSLRRRNKRMRLFY